MIKIQTLRCDDIHCTFTFTEQKALAEEKEQRERQLRKRQKQQEKQLKREAYEALERQKKMMAEETDKAIKGKSDGICKSLYKYNCERTSYNVENW